MAPAVFQRAQRVGVDAPGIGVGRRCAAAGDGLFDAKLRSTETQRPPNQVELFPRRQAVDPEIAAPAVP